MRVAVATALLAAAALFGGCGETERDQVKAKVEQFASAAASKDYKTICKQVLAPSLLARLSEGGITCEQAMRIGLANVRDPSLSIGRITIEGSHASVITLTAAVGQEASLDAIELIKTGAGWRISSLGSPVLPKR